MPCISAQTTLTLRTTVKDKGIGTQMMTKKVAIPCPCPFVFDVACSGINEKHPHSHKLDNYK